MDRDGTNLLNKEYVDMLLSGFHNRKADEERFPGKRRADTSQSDAEILNDIIADLMQCDRRR